MQTLKDDIKEKILKAGSKLFKEKGFKDTSMRDIASRADISAGNIYRYFKNKEQLINEMLFETENQISIFLESVPSKHSEIDHKEMYNLLISKIIEWYKQNGDAMNILISCKDLSHYREFKNKVTKMLSDKIYELSKSGMTEELNDITSGAIANSIFEGIVYIVTKDSNSIQKLEKDLKIYVKLIAINVNQ